jgi:hypothetical protein
MSAAIWGKTYAVCQAGRGWLPLSLATLLLLSATVPAAAGQGWYLLSPSVVSKGGKDADGNPRFELEAEPLGNWAQRGAFDTAAACEFARRSREISQREETTRRKREDLVGALLEIAATSAKCVASDDPRLTADQGGEVSRGAVMVKNGFRTGHDYRALTGSQQRNYLTGVVDGMFLAPLYGAPKTRMAWLEACLPGMSDEQVQAIVDSFVTVNPQRWHDSMHTTVYAALLRACERSTR